MLLYLKGFDINEINTILNNIIPRKATQLKENKPINIHNKNDKGTKAFDFNIYL